MVKSISNKHLLLAIVSLALLISLSLGVWIIYGSPSGPVQNSPVEFDGERAFQFAKAQVDLGPRIPGNAAHENVVRWLDAQMSSAGWSVEVQNVMVGGQPISNVIAKRGSGPPWIILGAHYDSRIWADRDPNPENRQKPVPGANDGASGVAVLVELAQVLPEGLASEIWLVFFDAEDNGDIPGWDWIMGSRAFVSSLEGTPDAVVIVDMIGDRDLEIFLEHNSDIALATSIWDKAAELGYGEYFVPDPKYRMLDDHVPFLEAGIPAVLIIDFDYPYWHTISDTIDKISADSFKIVGDTLLAWLLEQ